MIILVKSGQDIYDISLQYYGSIDFVANVMSDNSLSFNDRLLTGQELVINATGSGNEDIKDFYVLQDEICFNQRDTGVVLPIGWQTDSVFWQTGGITWGS